MTSSTIPMSAVFTSARNSGCDVLSIQPGGVDGASFCKRLTSQTENVTRGVNVAIMNSAALATRPFSYFETLQPFRAADASAFGTGQSGRCSEVSTNVATRAIAFYRSMLRDIPVLASADDVPFVA
jgi:hypothetical protein